MTRSGLGRPAAVLTGASVVAAGLGWVTLALVGRVFGPATYAEFTVWWSLYFAAASVLVGLQQVVAADQLRQAGQPGTRDQRHPVRELVALTLPPAVLAWGALVWLLPSPRPGVLGVLLPVTVGVVGCLVLASETLGLLVAQGRWAALGVLGVVDAGLRLALVLVVVSRWPTPAGYVGGVVVSVVVFVPLAVRGDWRFGAAARFGGPGFVRRAGLSMLGAGCLGVLSVGMPALIQMTGDSPSDDAARLFATLVLLRSPVLLVAGAVRPLVLRHLAARPADGVGPTGSRLGSLVAATLAAGAAGSWLLGPHVVALLFGPAFAPERLEAAVVGTSGVLLALTAISATALVARGRERAALSGWLLALAVTVVTLRLPLDLQQRADLALLAGPAVGLVTHALLARRP